MVKFRLMKKSLFTDRNRVSPALLLGALLACSRQPITTPPPSTLTPIPSVAPSPSATFSLVTVEPTLTPTATATPPSRFAPVTEADWQTGPANAAVTILEYSDFQCANCAQLAAVLTRLREEYPDDLRVVYRHFPLITVYNKTLIAAEAAETVGAQGKFWEMHDLLFNRQADWIELSQSAFVAWLNTQAKSLDLDYDQFSADFQAGKYLQTVATAHNTALSIPLPGVPFLILNGRPYEGPVDHWSLAALIRLEKLKQRQFQSPPPDLINPFGQYTATLQTVKGEVVIELLAEKAPLTVNNFVFLAQANWFDGITFYAVRPKPDLRCWDYLGPNADAIPIVQTGDPSETGLGGPGYLIPDEINPDLNFDAAGWVGMVNNGPNANGSQFFITLAAMPELNGRHTLFGKVVNSEGLGVLSRLTPRDPCADPEAPSGDLITSVHIEEK